MQNRREAFVTMSVIGAVASVAYLVGRKDQYIASVIQHLQKRKVGPSVAETSLRRKDGSTTKLKEQLIGSEGALLYGFRMECPWCSRNRPSINALTSQLRGRYEVLGLIMDDEWPPAGWYRFPSFRYEHSHSSPLSFSVTPTSVLLDASYRQTDRLEGAYTQSVREHLANSLGVTLPELG
jgi:hypothetical protein